MRLLSTLGACGEPAFDQRLHVGERVEQEMRLDLRLQQMQARVERLALEFAALEREGRSLIADEGVALMHHGTHGDPGREHKPRDGEHGVAGEPR